MDQNGCPLSLSVSRGQWGIIPSLLKGLVIGLVLVWLAPLLSITVPDGVFHRDSILAATVCLSRIPGALGRVQEERSRTAAERDAFEDFANHIETMDPDTQLAPARPVRGQLMLSEESSQSGVAMDRVRAAYRETVMATEHYHDDYAESFTTNVTEEFGPDLATALTEGEKLTPQLQRALIEASHTAANERTTYGQALTTEYNNLQTAKQRLHTLAKILDRIRTQLRTPETFSALITAHAHMENLTADCARLLDTRQATLADLPQNEQHHLTEYLYQEYQWTYPVLADTLDGHVHIRELEHNPVEAISRYP